MARRSVPGQLSRQGDCRPPYHSECPESAAITGECGVRRTLHIDAFAAGTACVGSCRGTGTGCGLLHAALDHSEVGELPNNFSADLEFTLVVFAHDAPRSPCRVLRESGSS